MGVLLDPECGHHGKKQILGGMRVVLESVDLVPDIFRITFAHRELAIVKFHFKEVDDIVSPVDYKIDLCSFFGTLFDPAIVFRQDLRDPQFCFDLPDVL